MPLVGETAAPSVSRVRDTTEPVLARSLNAGFVSGASVGVLGGLIGVRGAEFSRRTGGRVTGIAVTGVDGDTSPRDVGALLLEAGIDWAVERELTFDKQLCLRADSGVLVLFDLERGSLQRLISEGSPLGFVDAGPAQSGADGRRRTTPRRARFLGMARQPQIVSVAT